MVVIWRGAEFSQAAKRAIVKSIQTDAEIIKGEAVQRAPLDESTLRGSATVTDIKNGAEVSFNTPYAVIMHEWEGYTPSHPGTGPGYLRQPLLDNQDKISENIKKAIESAI
jgi:hypothetical protein